MPANQLGKMVSIRLHSHEMNERIVEKNCAEQMIITDLLSD